jgi:hypothetical protein
MIFWGDYDSKEVFNVQNKRIRIMVGLKKKRMSCRELFEKLNILSLAIEFLWHCHLLWIKVEKLLTCGVNTGHKCYFHHCTWVPIWWQVADVCAVARDIMYSLLL